ncbi:helix-turn-helix domain-containing protein [Neobacillus pocheonensis]|uniref:Helix-turn-helix domain-containing protein n=1 Tax=Neobacillus pocheonensis TaxID=363869 RepID=A0ABT0W888_9BACI|nr:helix-turn-helix domain-containing protein [Neobacillus pocheonensis]
MTKYQKVMLNVKDIMEITGIGRDNAYALMRSGQFPIKMIGRKMLVHEEIFQNWLKGDLKGYEGKKKVHNRRNRD